jgi:HAD superfamily 5'-nucleotidase-like hydrolase
MAIYVNRVLNMKYIKTIGFDMDHTLVRYHSDKFEELTFNVSIKKLAEEEEFDYPAEILDFKFDFNDAIRGLVIDKENGNILKVSLYNKIKNAYHGTKPLSYREQRTIYKGSNVDLSEDKFMSIDTTFAISFSVIYAQMIDLKNKKPDVVVQSYAEIAADIQRAVDIAHRDGSLKGAVTSDFEKYIIKDEKIVAALERFRKYDKKLWLITNSDYKYTKALLDYTINPYLKDHESWMDLFEITVTLASKPRFFTDKLPILKVNPENALLENHDGKTVPGIYQGGCAQKLQEHMGLKGDEILYIGDHIYGDILRLKKSIGWRTAAVIEELDKEVSAYKETKEISIEIDRLMEEKVALEKELDDLYAKEHEFGEDVSKDEVNSKFSEMEKLDKAVGKQIKLYESHYNAKWGEVMRAGAEPSVFAFQVERYACIYMAKISDFYDYSPRTYYRPKKKKISHEM